MWEWIKIVAQRIESMTGFRVPAAKGATVRGISPIDRALQVCVS